MYRVLTIIDYPKIAGANSPIFKIAGTKAPIAPVQTRPLLRTVLEKYCSTYWITDTKPLKIIYHIFEVLMKIILIYLGID